MARARAPLLLSMLLGLGCEDAPRPTSPALGSGQSETQPAASAAARPAAPAGAPAAAGAAGTAKGEGQAEAKVDVLTEADFIESLQNRDPFRSHLSEVAGPRTAQSEWEVLLKKYALDELKLIAIVSGGTAPRAMFQNPIGEGVTVKRGDRLSKSEGKVTKILSDRVIVEIEDAQASKDKPEVLRRELLLHPEEPRE